MVHTKPILSIKPGKFAEFCGWYGMIALIFAYFLVSFSWTSGDGIVYQVLNLTGGIGLLIVAASKRVVQSVILNFFWAFIGVIAIVRIFL
ncbi:MAG: hypothetical protein ABIP50_03650 [Candidatus Saccharimonadales bacterium]